MTGLAKAAFRGVMACALSIGCASAGTAATMLPQSWNNWKWARTGPLSIQLGDNVSAAWDPFLSNAARQWSAGAHTIDFVLAAGRSSSPALCNPKYGTVQACSSNYGATGWLGWAQVWTSGNYIVQATVKLNDYYFQSNSGFNTTAHRAMTACHELGHTLGLNHSDSIKTNLNIGSCLDYTNDPSGTRGTNGTLANIAPNGLDFTNLNRIYATLDRTQIPGTRSMVMSFNALSVPEPTTWAMLIAGFGLVGSALRRRSQNLVLA